MKKIKCVVLALLFAFLFSNNQNLLSAQDLSHESDLEYILTNYYILGNYEEVIRLLNKYYLNHQKELSYLYGLCYLNLNMNKLAIDYFNITLAEHENNYEVLNNIGVAYFKENDFVNAMKYFHLSFTSNTSYKIAQLNYNEAHKNWSAKIENGNISPVIPFTEKPTMYSSIGWFYYYSGDFHNAIYYFNKAIEEDGKYQFAYIALAYIYIEGNNFETALDFLKKAEKISDKNPDLYNNLGIIYYHLNNFKNSEKAFKKAITLNKRFAEPYNNLGFLYFEKANYKQSEENFRKSIELNPDNPALKAESTAGLAVICMKNNKPEQAKAYKETSIGLDYRMKDIKYLTNILKWNKKLIEIWDGI